MIFEILNNLLFAAPDALSAVSALPLFTAQNGIHFDCASMGISCPGSSFTAVGAAFATQGYFVQSDIIHYLLTSDMGLWAPLLYILAAFAGMVGVATGASPRNYMWFFIGPAFYHWLVATPEYVHGTEWRVGNLPQDQREVWKLAEVGLINSRIIRRLNYRVYNDAPPNGGPKGDGSVPVSYVFAWYDALVSDTIQWLISWTGAYDQRDNSGVADSATNIAQRGATTADRSRMIGGQNWHLLTNLKWSYLEDITNSSLHNAQLRDAFISFMAGECGDHLANFVDIDSFTAAQNARGGNVPYSIFFKNTQGDKNYQEIYEYLAKRYVPVEPALVTLLQPNKRAVVPTGSGLPDNVAGGHRDRSGLRQFFDQMTLDGLHAVQLTKMIRCSDYLHVVIQGFRWEAAHIFYQMAISKRPNIFPQDLVYSLFYGWDIRKCSTPGDNCTADRLLTEEEQMNYLRDLILVYLFRNEMRLAPKVFANPRDSLAKKSEQYAEMQMRTAGQKTKFAEIFTWANLVPYVQGTLLYFLAIAYPLACILVVVPGWHKTIFTWMSFWAWAKLWDLGFALVYVIERSVWAMIGNGADARRVADKVVELQSMHSVGFNCLASDASMRDMPSGFTCIVPKVCDIACVGGDGFTAGGTMQNATLGLFDRAMTLTGSLDLDLANSYYIYIMAALYLAVPAVTGQLVLGAKAGAAGLVGTMIGGASSEAGRAAGGGFSSDMTQRSRGAFAAIGQTAYMKGLRQAELGEGGASGEGGKAFLTGAYFGMQNKGKEAGMAASLGGQMREQYGALGNLLGHQSTMTGGVIGLAKAGLAKEAAALGALSHYGGGAANSVGGKGGGLVGGLIGGASNLHGHIASPAVTWAAAQDEFKLAAKSGAALMGVYAGQAQAAKDTYMGQALSEGYNAAGQRIGALADFQGQTAAWAAKNDYTHATAGDLAAMGVSQLDAGSKPQTFEGAAMAGMLDSDEHIADRSMMKIARDSDGNALFEKNADGNFKLDENNSKIPQMEHASVKDLANFGIDKDGSFANSDAAHIFDNLTKRMDDADLKPDEMIGDAQDKLGLKSVTGYEPGKPSAAGLDYDHYTRSVLNDASARIAPFAADLIESLTKTATGDEAKAAMAQDAQAQLRDTGGSTAGVALGAQMLSFYEKMLEAKVNPEDAAASLYSKYKGFFDQFNAGPGEIMNAFNDQKGYDAPKIMDALKSNFFNTNEPPVLGPQHIQGLPRVLAVEKPKDPTPVQSMNPELNRMFKTGRIYDTE